MKIISGKLKGRTIKGIKNVTTRPLTGFIKEAIFNILRDEIVSVNILDIFCGFGSFGIEALSRGAKSVNFIDKDKKVCSILKKNINDLKISDNTKILCDDVFSVLTYLNKKQYKFDLIFADPPFPFTKINELQEPVSNILNKNGLFILRHSKHFKFVRDKCFYNIMERKYLPSILQFLRHSK